jgi:hypothetical protein
MKRSVIVGLLSFLIPSMLWAQTTDTGKPRKVITDASIGGSNYTFDRDTVYVLDGYVYFEAPGTLTIESGTVIKGVQDPTNGIDLGSCLVITKNADINAQGTPTEPIIFTSEYDSVALADNGPDPGVDYTLDQGLWGGVILCGNAVLNISSTAIIEGLPASDSRGEYGGADDNDSSGVFRYVSIRYSGVLVEANKELQSLTMGCVGSRTVVEYVESFNSADDGFEFFGGTCNTRYLASVFADDDAFDYDHGFRGNHQFWFALQARNKGDNIGEFDSGDTGALTNQPLANPVMYNVTFIGRGDTATAGGNAVRYKEFAGGRIFNSIFADFQGTNNFNIDSGSGATCYNRLVDSVDQLVNQNNIWYKGAAYTTFNQFVSKQFQYTYLSNGGNANTISDPQFTNLTRVAGGGGDFRPQAGSPAYTLPRKALPVDPWWTTADYYGAFGPDNNWIGGWTALAQLGIVVDVKGDVVESGRTPTDFVLKQNYPNPFNPSTTIRFDVRSDAKVKLTVYNVLGQAVATLVDGFKAAGAYEVQWNAADVASGVYFYRLESGDFKQTRKMLLIK